jgi:predicted aspartyl protease
VISVTTTKWLVSAGLAVVLFPTVLFSELWAEFHCPGNAVSIRPRFIGRSLIVVRVILDNTGPYDFVVDTGAQITTIDLRLAAKLHPKSLGATHVAGLSTYSRAAYAQLGSLQIGSYSAKDPLVIVQDLSQLPLPDPRIRGILGENVLEHFDLLIDYETRLLCLDETKQLQQAVRGERIALTPPRNAEGYNAFMLPMVVEIRVTGISDRPLLLALDSGTDVPLLFESGKWLPRVETIGVAQGHRDADEIAQAFALLMPQDIRIGGHSFRQVSFVTPVVAGKRFR